MTRWGKLLLLVDPTNTGTWLSNAGPCGALTPSGKKFVGVAAFIPIGLKVR